MKQVKFTNLGNGITPVAMSQGAAAFDLFCPEDIIVMPGRQVIKTNIAMEIPHGMAAIVQGRSGNSAKGFLVDRLGRECRVDIDVEIGLIDSDYRGDIGVILNAHDPFVDSGFVKIKKGQAIAQLRFVEVPDVELCEVTALSDTERGNGGFGSTDNNNINN